MVWDMVRSVVCL